MSLVDTTWSSSARVPLTGLFARKISVFYTATVLFADYKICQWRCNQLPLHDETGRDAIWSETHNRNSKFVMNQFITLEGLWVKVGISAPPTCHRQSPCSSVDFMSYPTSSSLGFVARPILIQQS